MKNKDIPPVWGTAYDQFGDPSEVFTVSREGLTYLKEKIEESLSKGHAEIGSDAHFDFTKIAISDTHPTRTLKPRPILDRVMRFLGLAIVVTAVMLVFYGAHALYIDLTK
jgi:hypothetical protein